jgi:bifunctional enzyme CysN/CysC
MATDNDLRESTGALAAYLSGQERKSLLRFITCGSVDDGKSTLIGRLLYDTRLIFEDQLAALERDSKKHGTTGDDIDFALLVDGLEAEREQGITIDVAYRFFATPKRKFIVADTPGHVQYTRNMATGASTADLAVVLIDARKGVIDQTRRHSHIAALLGVRHVVLAVNKMDLVDFSRTVFDRVAADYRAFARDLRFESIVAIPLSARFGDNITELSGQTPWYSGPTLIGRLEDAPIEDDGAGRPFRFPVQWVNRPDADFRGYAGTIASGEIRVGDTVAVAASGRSSTVARILVGDREVAEAREGEAATLVLTEELDISRGDLLCPPERRPEVADQFTATLIWFDQHALIPGRPYLLRTETRQVGASITELKYQLDVNSFAHVAAKSLEMNGIGVCNIATQTPLAFDRYVDDRVTGAFVLIDRMTNATVGAGMIEHSLRRATNVLWQALDIDKVTRAAQKGQKPAVLWFTGLSGSGKSTIANILERRLNAAGRHTYLLDGDNVRHGLNRDLGFTEEDRVENIRRVAEVARLMADAGLIVLVSFISPFRAERRLARERLEEGEFVEIFVDTPFEECARRDPKGLYARALRGEIKNFTGVDSPYEAPEHPEIHLRTTERTAEDMAEEVERWLSENGIVPAIGGHDVTG